MSGHLSKKQLNELKTSLLELKRRLQEELKSYSGEISNSALSGSNSVDSTHDDAFAEAGSQTFEREKDLALIESLRTELEKVEESLAKIEEGTYGVCSNCGADIAYERLKAIPYTDRCLECRKKGE